MNASSSSVPFVFIEDAVIDDLLEDETKVEPEDAAAPVVTEKVIEKEA
jgi:hypothetical protein